MDHDTEQGAIVQTLLGLYARGQFPMGEPGTGDVFVYEPDPRAIIPLDARFHVPRSLAQRVRAGRFDVRSDTAFERVVRECAAPRAGEDGHEGTWITDEIVGWYVALHRGGHAHSVEAWLVEDGAERLVGGLYGVHLGGLFAGESMFSMPAEGGTDASKVCLVHLVGHLRGRGFTLLDAQFMTEHLHRFGAMEVRRHSYRVMVGEATKVDAVWGAWGAVESGRRGLTGG